MLSLQTQIRICTRAQLILGIVVLLTGVAFYVFGYRPATLRLKELHAQTSAKEQELSDNMRKSRDLPAVAQEVRKLRLQLEGAKKMPKDPDIPGFINDLTRISLASQIKKPQYKPDPTPRKREMFSQYTIQIQLQGNFMNVFSFLHDTENLPRLARVKSIELTPDPQKPGAVMANIGMDLYFSADQ